MKLFRPLFLILILIFVNCDSPEGSGIPSYPKDNQEYILDLKNKLLHYEISNDSIDLILNKIKSDNLKWKVSEYTAYNYYSTDDSLKFRFWNNKALDFSTAAKDTFNIAQSYRTLGNFMYRHNQYDSSYYYYNRALNYYRMLGKDFYSGRVLMNMATIQRNVKDYLGSEVTTMQAIELLKPLEKNRRLYLAYNNLGIIYNELEEYEEALEYHEEALTYQQALGDEILKASSLNNIGVVHENQENYQLALEKYREALALDSVYHKNPRLYAMLLDNMGYSLLKAKDTATTRKWFSMALKIRDSIGHEAGIAINKIHLSQYYLMKKDTLEAIRLVNEAKKLSRETKNYRDLLHSLLLLGKIDKENSKQNLIKYIALNDSLQKTERVVRNRFARIRFETDEFIAENEYLNKERKLIFGGSVVSVGILLMFFVIIFQRNRNKQLKLEQAQQKSNEEIYNLLLVQHDKLEEGRNREKKRISQELHDGILGKLFGIRFMLNSLYDKTDEGSVESKKKYLEDLKGIETEIRNISHDLNTQFLSSQVSFMKIVDEFLTDHEKLTGLEFDLRNDPSLKWEEVSSKIKINMFRIIQEAIHNTTKHSGAGLVSINFQNEADKIIKMLISDNGKGFDAEKVPDGIGLKNMRSRVKNLEGSIIIKSSAAGTRIEIGIPR